MGTLRRGGVITQSTAMVEHNSDYHGDEALYVGEMYNNATGTLGNYITGTTSGGTVTEDGANGMFTLSSGIGAAGYAIVGLKQATRKVTLGSKPVAFSCRVKTVVNGVGVDRHTIIGFYEAFTAVPFAANSSGVFFHQLADNTWLARSNNQGVDDTSSASVLTISDEDILSIAATANRIRMYQNGTVVLDHRTVDAIPTVAMDVGASVIATAATVSTARKVSLTSYTYLRYV